MRDWDRLVDRAMTKIVRAFGQEITFASGAPVPFGETAPDPVTVRAVFDAAHKEIDTSGPVPINTVAPMIELPANALPWALGEGDTATIDGVVYTIAEVRPDGAGNIRCIVREGDVARW